MRGIHFSIILSLLLISNAGCLRSRVPATRATTQSSPIQFSIPLNCSAIPNTVTPASGQSVSVTLSVSGGAAPYTILGTQVQFSSQTQIGESFSSSASSAEIQSKIYIIRDSSGASTSCGMIVSVQSSSSGSSSNSTPLSCNLVVNPNPARVGQSLTLLATASGGNGTYTFGTLYADWNTPMTSNSFGSNGIQGTYSYPTEKTYSPYVSVQSGNQTVVCRTLVDVRTPRIDVIASPSSTVDAGTPIQVQVVPRGFDPNLNVNVSYSSSDSSVAIAQNSTDPNLFTLTAPNNLARNFNVTFTATTSDGGVASKSLQLAFRPSLTCQLSLVSPDVLSTTGKNIAFNLTSNTGETISVVQASASPEGQVWSNSYNSLQAKFQTSGLKVLSVTAASVSRPGVMCNLGNPISFSLPVVKELSGCSVRSNISPVQVGSPVRFDVSIPHYEGSGHFQMTLTSEGPTRLVANDNPLSDTLVYSEAGVFNVQARVRDLDYGTVAVCATQQVVLFRSGLNANVYRLTPWEVNPLQNLYSKTPVQYFTATNLEVGVRKWTYGFPGVIGLKEWFAVEYSGTIFLPQSGVYRFSLNSDDGSIAMIDGLTVANIDGIHPMRKNEGPSTYFTAGYHTFNVRYYQGPRTEMGLQFRWNLPSEGVFTVIPDWAYYRR